METAEKLFEKAKRLKKEDLSRLVALLDEYLSSEVDAKHSGSPIVGKRLQGTGG